MAHVRLFLSTVSAEFKSYREMLRHNLDLPDVTIKIQEDFFAGGIPTLEKLNIYIRECNAVIHLEGDGLGSHAKPRSIAFLNENCPELASRFPSLGGFLAPEGPSLSYTQWEAWLALLHGRKLLLCVPTPEAPREEGFTCDPDQQVLQQEHLARLRAFEAYPEVSFRSIDHLTSQIWKSLHRELLIPSQTIERKGRLSRDKEAILIALSNVDSLAEDSLAQSSSISELKAEVLLRELRGEGYVRKIPDPRQPCNVWGLTNVPVQGSGCVVARMHA